LQFDRRRILHELAFATPVNLRAVRAISGGIA